MKICRRKAWRAHALCLALPLPLSRFPIRKPSDLLNNNISMATPDALLRSSLLSLALLLILVGISTLSLRKVIATYVFGLFAIAGILLPDWEFFDRNFSEWLSPMPANRRSRDSAPNFTAERFKVYPVRLALYITIYSFGLYKWWKFITN